MLRNSNREDDVKTNDSNNKGEDINGESDINKKFDAILKDIKYNGKTSKSVSVKNKVISINLHP